MNEIVIKLDLEAAEKSFFIAKRNFDTALKQMIEYNAIIEYKRNRLSKLGIETFRERPWGTIRFE